MRDSPSGLHYLHQDHLGSTALQTSASGAAEGTQFRGPFGQPWVASGTLATDFQYTGQRSFESGVSGAAGSLGSLAFYGSRWYSPALGRFLQPDTIVPGAADPQNLNRYSYVGNNPLRYTDPTGHFAVALAVPLAAVGAVGGATVLAAVAVVAVGAAVVVVAVVGPEQTLENVQGWINWAKGSGDEREGNAQARNGDEAQSTPRSIAGHSWEAHEKEFGFLDPPITSEEELAEHIQGVMENPTKTRTTEAGHEVYWDEASGTIVIHNPDVPYQGTAYIGDEDDFWDAW